MSCDDFFVPTTCIRPALGFVHLQAVSVFAPSCTDHAPIIVSTDDVWGAILFKSTLTRVLLVMPV